MLLCLIARCAIAIVWTVFPYPISARSRIRKMLGRSLFALANFYSYMHATINIWIDEAQNKDQSLPHSLEETKDKLFVEQMSLLTTLQTHSYFTIYEPAVGGKFPKSTYDHIISEVQNVAISIALKAQTAKGLDDLSTQKEQKMASTSCVCD